jgi:hypothetical protein
MGLIMRKKIDNRSSYTVGYGRPPNASQFKPGQSGNAKGRPTGARNISSMARDALERTINVKEKGSWRKTTVRKAAYRRLAEKAIAGDVKALDYLLSLERAERPPCSDQPESEKSSALDLAILQDFFNRQRASLPQHERHDDQKPRCSQNERNKK